MTPLLTIHPELGAWRTRTFGLILGLVTGIDFIANTMIAIGGVAIQNALGASTSAFLWALTTYATAAVVANLVLAQVARRISYRRFSVIALLVFAAGALGCAYASDAVQLALARALQGLGGGALFAASRILVQLTARPSERLTLFWGFGIGSFGLAALAPWLTTWLIGVGGWQSMFLFQAGLAVPMAALVHLIYPRRPEHAATSPTRFGHLDWPAVVLLCCGALLVLHTLEQMRSPQSTGAALLFLGAGAGCFALAARRLHRHPDPWLDLRRLRSRRYLAGMGFYGLFYLFSGAWNYVVPLLLISGLAFAPTTAGALMSAGGAFTVLTLVVFHLLMHHVTRKHVFIASGYVVLAGAAVILAWLARPGAHPATIVAPLLLQGITPIMVMLQVAMMTYVEIPVEDFAHAYQLKNIMREAVSALGTGSAALFLFQAQGTATGLGGEDARHAVLTAGQQFLYVLASLSLLAAALALWQKRIR